MQTLTQHNLAQPELTPTGEDGAGVYCPVCFARGLQVELFKSGGTTLDVERGYGFAGVVCLGCGFVGALRLTADQFQAAASDAAFDFSISTPSSG